MKRLLLSLVLVFAGIGFAQVATAEVQGVELTAAKSPEGTGAVMDESVGEKTILVIALDADGNPVADAPVSWTIANGTENTVYVVGSSHMMEATMAEGEAELVVDGGVTNENGEAYLTVDSETPGDTKVLVTVGEVEGKTYRGKDMRVVWF